MAGSEWAKSQDGLLWLKLAGKTMESNWAKRSQLGPGLSWAWPILTRSQDTKGIISQTSTLRT